MNVTHEKSMPQKDMYSINLDLGRVFWLIAISLFLITFFFLFGYWLGSDFNYRDIEKDSITQKTNNKKWIALNDSESDNFSNLQEVRKLTNKALTDRFRERKLLIDLAERKREYKDLQNDFSKLKQKKQKRKRTVSKKKRISFKDNLLTRTAPYTIQVSTNKVKQNAYRLRNILKREKFRAYIVTKKNPRGVMLYLVRVGPFASESKAQNIRQEIRFLDEAKGSIIVNR